MWVWHCCTDYVAHDNLRYMQLSVNMHKWCTYIYAVFTILLVDNSLQNCRQLVHEKRIRNDLIFNELVGSTSSIILGSVLFSTIDNDELLEIRLGHTIFMNLYLRMSSWVVSNNNSELSTIQQKMNRTGWEIVY